MIARLLICPDIKKVKEEIQKSLAFNLEGYRTNHPDLLYIQTGEKLGIAEARKIKEHFALKPYSAKGRAVVLEDASEMTAEAQNALLKTLEELPKEAILMIGASSDANFLPTILSRCQITKLKNPTSHRTPTSEVGYIEDIERLILSGKEERFVYIEKLKNKEEFLHFLVYAFRQQLCAPKSNPAKLEIVNFLKELLQAEEWAKQNVNIRAILEYLMLKMPKLESSR